MSFPAYVTDKQNTEHYVDNFAAYTGDDTNPTRHGGSSGSKNRGPALQRWNAALRILTFLTALAAVLLTVFAKEKDNFGWTMQYTSSSAFVFFMIVNAVVCAYAFAVAAIAIVMCASGRRGSTPSALLLTVLILDVIGVVFLLLAFAAAMATEVIIVKGFFVSESTDYATYRISISSGICNQYGNFCTVIEVALGFCGASILSFLSSTAIDGYYLHVSGI